MLPENAVKYAYVTVEDGTEVFYRYAGNPSSPPFLLLHGYPSSSFQYRNLMPILAKYFYVVAPDLPAFGFTKPPKDFIYTFDNLSKVTQSFIDKVHLKKPMPVFIFDFGAPTAMRIYQRDPSYFNVIVTQNGNAYDEGLGPFWDKSGLRKFWTTPGAKEDRERIRKALQFESIKSKYIIDNPEPEQTVDPTSYYMDYLMGQKNAEAILDLFYDYRTNVEAYPLWNKQLRDNQPRVLATWGDRDPSFIGPGADAFAKDIKPENLTIHHLDAGHFALESHLQEIVDDIFKFFHIEE